MSPDAVKYPIGSEVFHKCEEGVGIVKGILFRESGTLYEVVWNCSGEGCFHEQCELQKEPITRSEITGNDEEEASA